MRVALLGAAFAAMISLAHANDSAPNTLPSGDSFVIEKWLTGTERDSERCHDYSYLLRASKPLVTKADAEILADDAMEFYFGDGAADSSCKFVEISVVGSSAPSSSRGFISTYARTGEREFKIVGREPRPRLPPIAVTGPFAMPSGAGLYQDRLYTGKADYVDHPDTAEFAEYHPANRESLKTRQDLYALLREVWYARVKDAADTAHAKVAWLALYLDPPHNRFDFNNRLVVQFSRKPFGAWPDLPPNMGQ